MALEVYLIGLNHRTAGVDIREGFALTQFCTKEQWLLPPECGIAESLILSTCNRVEILAAGEGDVPGIIIRHWAEARGHTAEELQHYVYVYKGMEAVSHLFTVASSLDSMILGEPQILGQLKKAYRNAVASNATGTIVNSLLHKAFSVAKRVRTETAVASSAVSISYAAVELAKRIFGDMHEYKAMLVGAGEMAELAAAHLLQAGISQIYVANRTLERGQDLAKQFNGLAVPFEQLLKTLVDVDIVISSTGSMETILHARELKDVLKQRKYRPMFFIDIAVPRDIDPDVNALDNVYLYDIDDLKEVVEENLATRREEAVKAKGIVAEEVEHFSRWLQSLDAQPTIVDIIERGDRIAHEELARTLKRLGTVDEETKEALHVMVHALARKMNHDPIMFLKRGTMSQQGFAPRINIVRRMFRLDSHQGDVPEFIEQDLPPVPPYEPCLYEATCPHRKEDEQACTSCPHMTPASTAKDCHALLHH
jgi:glutamyl-tRNA reductase